MQATSSGVKGLPENAYKELAPGEEYQPILPAQATPAEVTPWSVGWGLFMAVLFSAAAAYSGLKIGQVFEAAIPIAILAVGLSTVTRREGALSQNVIIQSIGACSGVIVAGAIFTIPALYILELPVTFFQLFAASALGGVLGVLFLIPFRRYFVKDMHGTLPFPEATATTEILVAGEKGGDQASVLLRAGLLGGIFDFSYSAFKLFSEVVTTRMVGVGADVADKMKLVGKLNVSPLIIGMGYIVGLRYSAIIVAGSLLSWFLLVPLVYYVGAGLTAPLGATATKLVSQMSAEEIFRGYVRPIGIGAIAMAGIIGIIRSWRIIVEAFGLAAKVLFHQQEGSDETIPRTQRDIRMVHNASLIVVTLLLLFAFFRLFVVQSMLHALVGVGIVVVISFLFTTVAANAIAIVGSNPVSGMTLMTLILSSFILVKVGLNGNEGMTAALLIGGVVCTALSVAGGFITDLKIGYWIGTTPKRQEAWKFLGILVSAATVGGVIFVMNQTFGFGEGANAMAAPQAKAMAAVIKPLMSDIPAPWTLYLLGAFISLIMLSIGIPPLAFALGMFLPQELNTPLILGGLLASSVTGSTDEKMNAARFSRGTLIASGFIAGASIFGVLNAFVRFFKIDPALWLGGLVGANMDHWADSALGQAAGLVLFLLLAAYMWLDTMKAKPEPDEA